jgi:hypothetical protein
MARRSSALGEEITLLDESYNEPEAETVDEEESPRLSLREQLEAGFDKISEKDSDESEDEEDTDDASARAGRARDDRGRFAKSQEQQSQESELEATTEGQDPELAIESAHPATPVLAPSGWDAEEREAFNQAPRKAQEAFVRRETELRRAFQQASERASHVERTWTEVDQALKPFEQQLGLAGIKPAQAVQQLMKWQQFLESDTDRALVQLAQSYGRTFGQLAQVEARQPQVSPEMRALQQQVQQLNGLLNQQQQFKQESEKAAIAAEVQSFCNETDANGNPLRPYIEHIIEDVTQVLQSLRSLKPQAPVRSLLQEAYEKAIWLNPSTRELEIRRAAPKPDKQTIEKARRAQKLVNGEARSAAGPDRSPKSVRDHLLASWEKMNPGSV